MEENSGLIQRAFAKATGANIHDLLVLVGYYRNAISVQESVLACWSEERKTQRILNIETYELVLSHFADSGKFPFTR